MLPNSDQNQDKLRNLIAGRYGDKGFFRIALLFFFIGVELYLLYNIFLMYQAGFALVALTCLGALAIITYIYTDARAYTYRYLFPGLATFGLFVVFPMVFTFLTGFTNYSSKHILSYDRAKRYFLSQSYASEDVRFDFKLFQEPGDKQSFRIYLTNDNEAFLSDPITGQSTGDVNIVAMPVDAAPADQAMSFKQVIAQRNFLNKITLAVPENRELRMVSLRKFGIQRPLYQEKSDQSLVNTKTGQILKPDFDVGYFVDEKGNNVAPGFKTTIGLKNYTRIFTSPEIKQPFIKVFIWTVVFSSVSVLTTLSIGMFLGVLLTWNSLKYKKIYRTLLLLPYAIPAFISILVFRGLFNANFGEFNIILDALFGIRPEWFTNPFLAKLMIIIVNTWLGYPYMMLLTIGYVQSIPGSLYEASAIDGSNPINNFFRITLPLITKPMMPLLISAFSFNFNNFVLIFLLTEGRPDFLNASTPAGTTDLLVSYTYRLAFQDSGQEFGFAASIATIVFIIVAVLSIINIKLTLSDSSADRR